jgi:hypothetical protein
MLFKYKCAELVIRQLAPIFLIIISYFIVAAIIIIKFIPNNTSQIQQILMQLLNNRVDNALWLGQDVARPLATAGTKKASDKTADGLIVSAEL